MTDSTEVTDGFDAPLPFDTDMGTVEPDVSPPEDGAWSGPLTAESLRLPPLTNSYVVGLAGAPIYRPEELDRTVDAGLQDQAGRAEFDARVAALVQQANSGYFHFELTRLHGADDPTVMGLEHGDSIVSLTRDHSDRKLTVVVVLSIDGADLGQLTHPALAAPQEIAVGSAVVFPSYVIPTLNVADGASMRAVVTHAVGPAFR